MMCKKRGFVGMLCIPLSTLFSAHHEHVIIKSVRERYATSVTYKNDGCQPLDFEIIQRAREQYKKEHKGNDPAPDQVLHYLATPKQVTVEGSFVFSNICKAFGYFLDRAVRAQKDFDHLLLAVEYGDTEKIVSLTTQDLLEFGYYYTDKKAPILGQEWEDPYTKALAYAAVAQGNEPLRIKHEKSDQMVDLLCSYRLLIPCAESPDGYIVQSSQKRGLLWWGLQYQDFFCVERALKEGTDAATREIPFHDYSPLAMALAGYKYGWDNLLTINALVTLLLDHDAEVDVTTERQFDNLQKKAKRERISLEHCFLKLHSIIARKKGEIQSDSEKESEKGLELLLCNSFDLTKSPTGSNSPDLETWDFVNDADRSCK